MLAQDTVEGGNKLDITKEDAFMRALHYMTHQKVSAHPKWGALEITEERIGILLSVVDNFNNSEHYPFYTETSNA